MGGAGGPIRWFCVSGLVHIGGRKEEMTLKKTMIRCIAVMAILACVGCASKKDAPGEAQEDGAKQYETALDVLLAVVGSYGEGELFAMYGGDQENAVMDAPGKFDISKTEELKSTLGLPEDQFPNIEDAASMVHMMNTNTFTGAAYRLKDGVEADSFADAVKSNLMATQWMCGQPDTLLILQVGGSYVITAYGEAGIMEVFKNNALSALSGAEVVVEAPVAS